MVLTWSLQFDQQKGALMQTSSSNAQIFFYILFLARECSKFGQGIIFWVFHLFLAQIYA